jgi:hypothetical protein
MFSEADGKRTDAHIHEPILLEAAQHESDQARRHMLEAIAGGMDPALAALLWG